ncbi:MAG TPA: DUF3369 domain-containing protein, partial [Beijerinckiaceae bacterium]
LDVVMEREHAGLDLVSYIRRDLGNETTRIILRTGQPGQAPEKDVIVRYDINDYKAKTELTADRLFTTITAALRGYQQLQRIERTKRGLEIIVDAADTLFDMRSLQKLAEGVLVQMSSLLASECAGILVLRDAGDEEPAVLAASGIYRDHASGSQLAALSPDLQRLIQETFGLKKTTFQRDRTVLYIHTPSGNEVVTLIEAGKPLSDTDRSLLEVFCGRLSIAFENVALYAQLQQMNATLERRVEERTMELQEANARLEAQWLRARRAGAYQSEVLGTVAHDIRNPLGVILGRTEIMQELLRSQPVEPSLLSAQIAHVRESAQRLTAMVTDLISDARADAVETALRRESVDLTALAQDVVDANALIAARKQQRIVFSARKGLHVRCDIDRMRDAIDNLVSNAIKYSPLDSEIHVATSEDGGSAVLSVRDSGPGLLPQDMGRLFGRFQRLSAKPTAGENSTGLGLAIAKRIVDLHSGEITAESSGAGKGSTFAIRLPLDGGGA